MITVAIIEDNRWFVTMETAMLKECNPRVILLDVGLRDRNSLRLAESVQKEMADGQPTAREARRVGRSPKQIAHR
jgi:hypothetical protein